MSIQAKNPHDRRSSLRLGIGFLVLVLFMSGCTLAQEDNSAALEATQVMLSVQATLDAEQIAAGEATRQAQEDLLNAQATQLAQQEEGNAQPTPEEQATATPADVAPTSPPTLAPTATSSEIPDEIVIQDWSMINWKELRSGCRFPDVPCWESVDKGAPMELSSKETFFIDPAWPNPRLVFWEKHVILTSGELSALIDGQVSPERLWSWNGNIYRPAILAWNEFSVDLSNFKGEVISIIFWVGGKGNRDDADSVWDLQNIRIIPDFAP